MQRTPEERVKWVTGGKKREKGGVKIALCHIPICKSLQTTLIQTTPMAPVPQNMGQIQHSMQSVHGAHRATRLVVKRHSSPCVQGLSPHKLPPQECMHRQDNARDNNVTSDAHVLHKHVWTKHEWSAIQGAPTVKGAQINDSRSPFPSINTATQQHALGYKKKTPKRCPARPTRSKFPGKNVKHSVGFIRIHL